MNAEFIAMLDYLERERGIKREILLEAVSNALLSASKKSVERLARSAHRHQPEDWRDPRAGQVAGGGGRHKPGGRDFAREGAQARPGRGRRRRGYLGGCHAQDFGASPRKPRSRPSCSASARRRKRTFTRSSRIARANRQRHGAALRTHDVIVDLGKFEAIMP